MKKKTECILWVCNLRDLTLLEFFLMHSTMLKMGKKEQMIGEFFLLIFFSSSCNWFLCGFFIFYLCSVVLWSSFVLFFCFCTLALLINDIQNFFIHFLMWYQKKFPNLFGVLHFIQFLLQFS